MKGIIMELNKDKIILLTKDGRFIEIDKPRRNVDVGEEINFSEKGNYNSNIRRFIAVAAIFCLVIMAGYGVHGYYNPYGYVNVDINPSVEITYNLYNRVIAMEGVNDDGNYIAKKLNTDAYKNKKVEEVVNIVIDAAEEKGYMTERKNAVLITLTDEKKDIDDEKLYNSISNHVVKQSEKEKNVETETIDSKDIDNKKEVNIKILSNTEEDYKVSKDKKVSPGKMKLVNKAIEKNKSLKEEELYAKPIKEIIDIIKSSREDIKLNKEERINLKKNVDRIKKEIEKEIRDKDKDKNKNKNKDKFRGNNKGKSKEELKDKVNKVKKFKDKSDKKELKNIKNKNINKSNNKIKSNNKEKIKDRINKIEELKDKFDKEKLKDIREEIIDKNKGNIKKRHKNINVDDLKDYINR